MELEKRSKIIDEALKEHYRETMERKRVPSDYLLMYTEGGETDAVACAIEKATLKEVGKFLEQFTEGDIYGDERTGDYLLFLVPPKIFKGLKRGKIIDEK